MEWNTAHHKFNIIITEFDIIFKLFITDPAFYMTPNIYGRLGQLGSCIDFILSCRQGLGGNQAKEAKNKTEKSRTVSQYCAKIILTFVPSTYFMYKSSTCL